MVELKLVVGLYFDRNDKTSMCDMNEQRKQECIKHSVVYHYDHFYTLIGTMEEIRLQNIQNILKVDLWKCFILVHMR